MSKTQDVAAASNYFLPVGEGKTYLSTAADQRPWEVLVIDDDRVLQSLTSTSLNGLSYFGRPVQLLQGFSGAEAKRLLDEHPHAAVILLDIVMKDETSGLAVVHHIRKFLRNPYIRIILCTGQFKPAPVGQLEKDRDINDYGEKTDLTARKLITCLTRSLQEYQKITLLAQLTSAAYK